MSRDYNRPSDSSMFEQNVSLTGGETKEFDIPNAVAVFVDKLQTIGTANAEISIAFGDKAGSPFIDLYSADLFRSASAPFGKVRLRNNNAVAIRLVHLIFSSDPSFKMLSPGGGNR